MRGAGSKGVVAAVRTFLGDLDLRQFGTRNAGQFRSRLDQTTRRLVRKLPRQARHWGLARKGLNIFLRDCLYTAYLRDRYHLHRAEEFFEVPLDRISAGQLFEASGRTLPRWMGVRRLDQPASALYQAVAAALAAERQIPRVHLDAIWWGDRDD